MTFMTANRRFTIDSNLLVYASDLEAGDKHEAARDLVFRATSVDCTLTLQALAEFFHVVTRKFGVSARVAAEIVNGWRDIFPVCFADDAVLVDAMDAVDGHNLSFWDAMLWATARRAGCRAVLSEDFQDGRELGGVVFINPLAATPSPMLEELIGS
jgi:predicted nucleic acid-binding protein